MQKELESLILLSLNNTVEDYPGGRISVEEQDKFFEEVAFQLESEGKDLDTDTEDQVWDYLITNKIR